MCFQIDAVKYRQYLFFVEKSDMIKNISDKIY